MGDRPRPGDHVAAVEHQYRYRALAAELLDLGAVLGAPGQRPELDHPTLDALDVVGHSRCVERLCRPEAWVGERARSAGQLRPRFARVEDHASDCTAAVLMRGE